MKKTILITLMVMAFVFVASLGFAQTLLEDCVDCLPNIIEQNWPAAAGCIVTALVGFAIRYFEKRKLVKELKKEK